MADSDTSVIDGLGWFEVYQGDTKVAWGNGPYLKCLTDAVRFGGYYTREGRPVWSVAGYHHMENQHDR